MNMGWKFSKFIFIFFKIILKKRETGFEPATLALARRYSTTEPLVHICKTLAGKSG